MSDSAPSSEAASAARPFQADVARLLELVVHSIYSDRDIFLRELISNAVDACEKLRFEIASGRQPPRESPFVVKLSVQKEADTLTIEDNGIGMDAAELESALGVIANSGTRAFLEAIESNKGKADGLIGKFGIGFYSSFMVADRVEVFTRRAGETQGYLWTSDGKSAYTIALSDEAPAHGARVVLHLKEDAREYLDSHKISAIVREHSAGVPIAIELTEQGTGEEPPKTQNLSEGQALWTRPKSELSPERYTEFYRTIFGHYDEPALTIHWRAEGRHEFDALAFVPAERPFDLFHPNRQGRGRLYVRRVLVADDAELLPPWLRFVSLLVDSADIPLNVSRELVQKSPILAAIRKAATNRVLQELAKLAESESEESCEKYAKFWKNFGAVLKEGLYEDPERRDALFNLARFSTSRHPAGGRSLKNYVADLRENQTAIYYLTGADLDSLAASPHLEAFAARDIEVLLLSDPVDSFWVGGALGYDGKPFKSAAQSGLDLNAIPLAEGRRAPEKREIQASDAAFLARLKQALEDVAGDVRASDHLQESAACLATPEHGVDRTLARILGEAGKGFEAKPILEVNLSNGLIATLAQSQKDEAAFNELARIVFGLAKIADGELPEQPARFARALSKFLTRGAIDGAGAAAGADGL